MRTRLGRPRRHRPDGGFTLVEVLVAMVILMIVLVGTGQFLTDQVAATGNLRNRTVAANLVDQTMETYRQESFTTLEAGADGTPTTTTVQVGSITYTITTTKRWQPTGVSGPCGNGNGGSNTAAVLFVEAAVSWRNMGGAPPVVATTTVAEPFAGGGSTGGNLQLTVTGASGAGSANVPVSLLDKTTNSTTTGLYTDGNGCLFVPNLTTDQYAVQLNAPGWVDPQENTAPTSLQFSVTPGNTQNEAMNYDQGGYISINYPAPPVTGPSVVLSNTSLVPNGTYSFSTSDSSVGPLYPYTNGYGVTVNGCSGPTSTNPSAAVPAPGGSAAVAVTWPVLTVTVYNRSGQPAAGGTVTVQCPGGGPTYTMPGTISSGGTITAALPPASGGSYTVTAYPAGGGNPLGSTTVAVPSNGNYAATIGTPAVTTTTSTSTTSTSTTTTTTTTTTSTTVPRTTTTAAATTTTTTAGP